MEPVINLNPSWKLECVQLFLSPICLTMASMVQPYSSSYDTIFRGRSYCCWFLFTVWKDRQKNVGHSVSLSILSAGHQTMYNSFNLSLLSFVFKFFLSLFSFVKSSQSDFKLDTFYTYPYLIDFFTKDKSFDIEPYRSWPLTHLQGVIPVPCDSFVHWQQNQVHSIVISLIQYLQDIGQHSGIC